MMDFSEHSRNSSSDAGDQEVRYSICSYFVIIYCMVVLNAVEYQYQVLAVHFLTFILEVFAVFNVILHVQHFQNSPKSFLVTRLKKYLINLIKMCQNMSKNKYFRSYAKKVYLWCDQLFGP